jgi:hypothetical protein
VSSAAASLPRRFASLVRIEHTVFALPFAYVGAFLAVDVSIAAGWLFVLAMISLTIGLLSFLFKMKYVAKVKAITVAQEPKGRLKTGVKRIECSGSREDRSIVARMRATSEDR